MLRCVTAALIGASRVFSFECENVHCVLTSSAASSVLGSRQYVRGSVSVEGSKQLLGFACELGIFAWATATLHDDEEASTRPAYHEVMHGFCNFFALFCPVLLSSVLYFPSSSFPSKTLMIYGCDNYTVGVIHCF